MRPTTKSAERPAAPQPLAPGARVGFVGLGHMGLPMARRLVDAGYDVAAFDNAAGARDAFAGASGRACVADLAGAAAGARAIVLMLPSSAVVDAVLVGGGLLDELDAGTVVVDMGSSQPERTRELADAAAARGAWLVDAPVSGGVAGAESGSLTIMAGGDTAVVEACRPLFDVLGQRVVPVGPVGAGHALKALNNLLSATHLLASAEALAIGRRFGLDPEVMLRAINGSTGRSASTENKLPRFVLTETYASGFALSLMLKDMKIALGLGRELGVPVRLSAAAVDAWQDAASALPTEADHTEIARWIEDDC